MGCLLVEGDKTVAGCSATRFATLGNAAGICSNLWQRNSSRSRALGRHGIVVEQASGSECRLRMQVLRTPSLRCGRRRCIRLLRCARLSLDRNSAAIKEAAMQLWTDSELMQMTREQLCELTAGLEHELKMYGPGTSTRSCLLASLRNIRRVILLHRLHF